MNANRFVGSRVASAARLTLAALLLLALVAGARAQSIPALVTLPASLATDRPDLVQERAALVAERGQLRAQSETHNTRCRSVPEHSPLESECAASQARFAQATNAHIERSRRFNAGAEGPSKKARFLELLHSREHRGTPMDAPLTNDAKNRNAYEYGRVLREFDVEKAERYEAGKQTFCNVYVSDVTRAMGAEIPLMLANDIQEWMHTKGKEQGWRRVDARGAQEMAKEGHPAIAVWKNTKISPDTGNPGHGHVAMIRPASVGDSRGDAISAAGRYVVEAKHMEEYFHKDAIQYWYHE